MVMVQHENETIAIGDSEFSDLMRTLYLAGYATTHPEAFDVLNKIWRAVTVEK